MELERSPWLRRLFIRVIPRCATKVRNFTGGSHYGASTVGQSSGFGSGFGRDPCNVFDHFVHELARCSRTLGVAITAEILSHFEPL